MESTVKAREKFENEKISFRGLAKEFGKSHTFWSTTAKKEAWIKYNPAKDVMVTNSTLFDKVGTMANDSEYKIEEGKGLLSSVAIRKVKEILEVLGDLYSPVDEPMIMQYALAYQRSIKLEKRVQEEGETLISAKSGQPYFNPTYSALLASNAQLIKIGNDFGFSIASRTKNTLDFGQKTNEPSIFDLIKDVLNE